MAINGNEALSLQEQRLYRQWNGGGESDAGHERARAILRRFELQTRPLVDVERARLFTESFARTEGQLMILRWAKALRHVAEHITVYIDDDQLLVGRAGRPGKYGILFPELDGDYLDHVFETAGSRPQSPFAITPEDTKIVVEEISPYWKGKTLHEHLALSFPPEVRRLTYDPADPSTSRLIISESASLKGSLQWVHDFEKVLKRGFSGIRREAEALRERLDPLSPLDNLRRYPFLDAVITVCDAIVLWARRHAAEAERLAALERHPPRRRELLDIAERCRHVPEYPARDFREAMQAQWFTQMFSRMEQKTGAIVSNGRMDQYFYPYYAADLAAGRINEAEAREWFECMWVAMAQYVDLNLTPTGGAFNEGYAHWEAVTVGGQTREGLDAANDLTYILLRSKREFPLNYPDLAARIHSRAPERYLYEVAETIKEGSGYPKLINDEEIVPLYVSKGATFEEAYDYAVSGCTEARMPNRDTYTSGCSYINMAAALEMALFNGRMSRYGDELLGLPTGDPAGFASWEAFFEAYLAQQTNLIKHAFMQQSVVNELRQRYQASPLGSALHDLCMKNMQDLHSMHIEGGIDLGYFEFLGYGTVIDSLSSVRKFVFDEKKLTMREVVEALSHNFEGREDMRQLLRSAPCYGNNDPYADDIGKKIDRAAQAYAAAYTHELGVYLDLRFVPITAHVPYGKIIGATPNGRKAGFPLSDGSSASHGADVNGPTSVLLSNMHTKNPRYRNHASRMLNIKLTPKCVAGREGTRKLVSMIRTFCDMKLWHLQFNIVNKATLLAAQRDPEKYRSLIVRVAGYSAYFTQLSPDMQDDIICRTEHAHI